MQRQHDGGKEGNQSTPFYLVTLGMVKLWWRKEGRSQEDITYAFYEALDGRSSSVLLLKLLACQGKQRGAHEATRDLLIDGIWGDKAEQIDAEKALNNAKCDLNRSLRQYEQGDLVYHLGGRGQGYGSSGYGLNPELLTLDADVFETLVAHASAAEGQDDKVRALSLWQQALSLMGGVFLPQDIYQDWSRGRRTHLVALHRLAIHRLSTLYGEQGRLTEAVECLHPYVLKHIEDEDALCILLPFFLKQDRYQEALDLCEQYRHFLEDEGEQIPPQFAELMKQLRHTQRCARLQQLTLPERLKSAPLTTLVLPPTPLPAKLAGEVSWFDLKLQQIRFLVTAFRGRAMYCEELQAILDQELSMSDHVQSLFEDFPVSRRKALLSLAAVSPALIALLKVDQPTTSQLEEFLPQCAASLTACQHLLQGNNFVGVEKSLKQFLPALESAAKQPSFHQLAAARLAAQGHRFLGLITWHRLDEQGCWWHYSQAVEYSDIAQDRTMQVIMLGHQGSTNAQSGNIQQARDLYQKALQYVSEASPLARDALYTRMAATSAQLGQELEALTYLEKARTVFPDHPEDDPGFSLVGTDLRYIHEGKTYLELSRSLSRNGHPSKNYLEEAWHAYAHPITDPRILTSERTRIQLVNGQAAVALNQRDLDKFEQYFLEGVQGAKALNSKKRKQEAVENWKQARSIWGKESKILELAEELM